MNLIFDKLKDELNEKIREEERIYGDILDKVLNENSEQLHTMLMKSDFQNYLLLSGLEKEEINLAEQADLSDLNLYEKELAKVGGNQTRWHIFCGLESCCG